MMGKESSTADELLRISTILKGLIPAHHRNYKGRSENC